MRRQYEKLLVAMLAGFVICGAAAMVVQPAAASAEAPRAAASAPIAISVLALDRLAG